MGGVRSGVRSGVGLWLREGLRAAFLRPPRTAGAAPTPWQLTIVLALAATINLVLARLEVPGPAAFDLRGWLVGYALEPFTLLVVWALLWRAPAASPALPQGLAAWIALTTVAWLPPAAAGWALAIAQARDALPPTYMAGGWQPWAIYSALTAWFIAIALRMGQAFGLGMPRLAVLAAAMLGLAVLGDWHVRDRPWEATLAEDAPDGPRLELSQETFEAQQALLDQSLASLAPQRPGTVDLYSIVYAPYAQDVFLRESAMVADVLARRFEAEGRVLQMVNHAQATATLPWATPANLRRAVAAAAGRMDRDEDVLAIYMTSHGARDFQLASQHWPLQVPSLTPQQLRKTLDEAGLRYRVIVVSACYSGGWVDPLASPDTLVMTAADPAHTSYGCGLRSELTFFGRALFDEQLRVKTRSFRQAFEQAVPVIKQREEEAGKPDGFSNPQLSMGERIGPVLDALAARLDGKETGAGGAR